MESEEFWLSSARIPRVKTPSTEPFRYTSSIIFQTISPNSDNVFFVCNISTTSDESRPIPLLVSLIANYMNTLVYHVLARILTYHFHYLLIICPRIFPLDTTSHVTPLPSSTQKVKSKQNQPNPVENIHHK
jgi:hypothetical protein